ncbi:NADH-quinone oxidoreductase subunit C [Candidatus Woesearchaeota archaeon]|nr:NADH-quinone oxidoreductase subunit C [Candidatus Woesearchaeota archaeon]
MKEFDPKKILETVKGGRLVAIVALDENKKISLIYYIEKEKGGIEELKTSLPKGKPIIESVHEIHPCGIIFEREIHDLFGVEFKGNEYLHESLFLPDDWKGKPPLLKDA